MKKKLLIITIVIFLFLTGCKTKTYTVTLVDGGTELKNVIVNKGDNLTDITSPEKEGYLFMSWLKDGNPYDLTNPITEDITLTASWTEAPTLPNTHTVTFDFGDYSKTQSVEDGACATKPKETPKKEKYKFIGWYSGESLYDFSTPVTKNIIITAKFEKDRILINFDLDGGTGTLQVEIDKGTVPDKPKDPSKFGYTFKYWSINGAMYNFDTPLTSDTTIKANYEANIYVKVTFDTDGGNTISSKMLILNEKLTELPIAIKDGYTFKYWSYNDHEFDINTKIDSDITLIAIYEKNEENPE